MRWSDLSPGTSVIDVISSLKHQMLPIAYGQSRGQLRLDTRPRASDLGGRVRLDLVSR